MMHIRNFVRSKVSSSSVTEWSAVFKWVCRLLATISLLMPCMASAEETDDSQATATQPQRSAAISFDRDIMPILKQHCVACHREGNAEGGLVLESWGSLQKGGDGGAPVVSQDVNASPLFARVTSTDDTMMPPEGNSVGAVPLNTEELQRLRQWIEQGAIDSDENTPDPVAWQPIPENFRSVYALDVSEDGQFVAIGRANRVLVVDLTNRSEMGTLIDPSLNAGDVADIDLVQAISISPDGERIATGGFRAVRVWRRAYGPSSVAATLSKAAGLVAVSSDATSAALVNAIGDVEIRDLPSGTERHAIRSDTRRIMGLVWATSANRLLIAEEDGRIRVCNPANGHLLAELDTKNTILDLEAASDGSFAVARMGSGSVELFCITSDNETTAIRRIQANLGGISDATAIGWVNGPSPQAIVAKGSGEVFFVDPNSNQLVRSIEHGAVVDALAVSNDESKLATGGRDGKTRLWAIADGTPLVALEGTPKDRRLLEQAEQDARYQERLLARLATHTGELAEALRKENEAIGSATTALEKAKEALAVEVKKHMDAMGLLAKLSEQLAENQALLARLQETAAALQTESENTNRLAADAKRLSDRSAAELDVQQKEVKLIEEARGKCETELNSRQQAFASVSASAQLAATALPDHQSRIDAETRRSSVMQSFLATARTLANEPGDGVTGVDFSPDAQRVATAHADGSTRIYRTSDGLPVTSSASAPDSDAQVAFVRDAVCRFGPGHAASLHPLTVRWQLERTIGGIEASIFPDRVTALRFRRDSLTVAVGGGTPTRTGDVKIFEVETGKLVRDFGEIHADTVLGLDFSPDGSLIASASADSTIQLLDIATGTSQRSLEGHTHHVMAVAWHEDGNVLASASADQSVKVWDAHSGDVLHTITGFPKELTAAQFVPASNQLAVACANGLVRLCDGSNGGSIRDLDAGGDFLHVARLTPDGKQILAGGQSGIVRIWDLTDGSLVGELK
jgi:WD40 repeat protein